MDFVQTVIALLLQGLHLLIDVVVWLLSLLLVLAREVLNLFHLS
jgi:hypothetical protein